MNTNKLDKEDVHNSKKLSIQKSQQHGYTTFFNYQLKKLNEELERKLPNEFKGCISNYNYRNMDCDYLVDENDYRY